MTSRKADGERLRPRQLRLPSASIPLEFCGERFTSLAEGTIEHEHFHRYLFAMEACRDKDVLDIACGEGYGSAAIALVARHVTGIDIDETVIEHCRKNYPAPNVEFLVGNALSISLPDRSIDVVVSFETLEHMIEHDEFLREISRVLRDDGQLIISTPDKNVYSPPGTAPNEFHLRELTRDEFERLLGAHFPYYHLGGQVAALSSTIAQLSDDSASSRNYFRRTDRTSYLASEQLERPVYLIAQASRAPIYPLPDSMLWDDSFLPGIHSAYRAELEKVWNEVSDREGRIAHQTEALRDAHVETGRYAEQLTAAHGDLGGLRDELTELQDELTKRRDEFTELQGELTKQRDEITKLHDELTRRRDEITTLHDELTRRQGEFARLQNELATERFTGADLAAALKDAQFKIVGQAASLAGLHETIQAIHASTSWRITGPLRALMRLVRSAHAPRSATGEARAARWVRLARDFVLLSNSSHFSADWYRNSYSDVARSGKNSLLHYLRYGVREDRDPAPGFSTSAYLRRYPDVAEAGFNPLAHFVRFGIREGRSAAAFIVDDRSDSSHGTGEPIAHECPDEPSDEKLLQDARRSCERLRTVSESEELQYRPLVSVLLPTYNTPVQYLTLCVDSVVRQSYQNWELIIVDDGSTSPELFEVLTKLAVRDDRIQVQRNTVNQGISGATNDALGRARGEFVAMLDHDDELIDDALLEIVRKLNTDPDLDVVYTDQDYIEADGRPSGLLLKPDWSPMLFYGVMFVGHLLVVRRTLANEVGGFDGRFNNVQDFEFMLRVSERTSRIAHVDKVLYHWRRIPGSVAHRGDAKSDIEVLQSRAVSEHLARRGINLVATPHARHAHRATLRPSSADRSAKVVVVPARGLRIDRLAGWLEESRGLHQVELCPSVEELHGESRASALRRVIADADYVLTIGRDVVGFESADWLQVLIAFCGLSGAGVVAGVGIGEERKVIDAGLILNAAGSFSDAMTGWDIDSDGYAGSLSCVREVIAVKGSVMATSVRTFDELGGIDDRLETSEHQWLDLSARATECGRYNLVLPTVIVVRKPASCEPDPASQLDSQLIRERWKSVFVRDPYHNRQFDVRSGGYSV
ncbi:glycosyltransferase [Variovorax sp. J2P1-59]|uniref:glycosyltransferase n=1 Tax=Variovorax flavidus TaxID=3053501 RepID=UPI00257824E1|nr:glycosyltransferase [Variovorax sp. J2P1-59]MDM0076643.1 glycosyltransferase [Variovorax sp. J2P1-59]